MVNNTVLLVVASETGNSFNAAEDFSYLLKRHHFNTSIISAETIDLSDIVKSPKIENFTVFFISTTGQGEIPASFKLLWQKLLLKNQSSSLLSNLRFSIFGLGDSSYVTFNHAALKLNVRLKQLGALSLCPVGLGDDQCEFGYQAALNLWSKQCLYSIKKSTNCGEIPPLEENHLFSPEFEFKIQKNQQNLIKSSDVIKNSENFKNCENGQNFDNFNIFNGFDGFFESKLIEKERLTCKTHFQNVTKFSFDISHVDKRFESGDVILIRPKNSKSDVKKLLDIYGLFESDKIQLNLSNKAHLLKNEQKNALKNTKFYKIYKIIKKFYQLKNNKKFQNNFQISAGVLFEEILAISETPKKGFFRILFNFSQTKLEKEKLDEFLSPEGQEDFDKFCSNESRTFVEVLESFPNSIPPLNFFIQNVPFLRPRKYSISSSFFKNEKKIEITVAIVKYKTPYKRVKNGVCSSYLNNLKIGEKSAIKIEKGSFFKPKNWLNSDLIAIGPGTGLSPLKAMVEERFVFYQNFNKNNQNNQKMIKIDQNLNKNNQKMIKIDQNMQKMGKIALFLGHRFEKKDFLYKENYWQQFSPVLSKFNVAFSRDCLTGKNYVQNDILKNADFLWDLMKNGAFIFISGNSKKMPQDVKETFLQIIKEKGNFSDLETKNFFNKLIRERRYQTETWQ